MTSTPLFGLLIQDREPFAVQHLPGLVQAWLQDAGGFAALGLVFYLLYALRVPAEQQASAKDRAGVGPFMLLMAVVAILCYAGYFFLVVTGKGRDVVNVPPANVPVGGFVKYTPPKFSTSPQPLALMAGGLFALLGIGQPFAAGLAKVSARRVGALAKLAFKEALRNRVLLALFGIAALTVLFPITWFIPPKPEDELRVAIKVTTGVSQVLVLLTAALLAAFSIPADIKNQNIYTIISKPVQRFEIVLGRFIGYGVLMSLALAGLTAVGWAFVYQSSIDPQARSETYMARKPLYGALDFRSRRELTGQRFEGTNVGREFDYRKYIAGDPSSSQRAEWRFADVPSGLAAGRDAVPCEFTFDIFRMIKGEENRGVDLNIRVVTWQNPQVPPAQQGEGSWRWADPDKQQQYDADARRLVEAAGMGGQNPAAVLAAARPGTPQWKVVNELAEKYGFYEVAGKEIFDYHPATVPVPAGLFANARADRPATDPEAAARPAVSVFVKCNTKGQMVGMAEPDLYLLRNESRPSAAEFAANYFKTAVGLWCRVLLVVGIAVACSTYLAGVISFLAVVFLYLSGLFADHLADLAQGSYVGGPFKAMNQLLEAKQPTMPLENNAVAKAVDVLDLAFGWLVRRFVNVVPDVYAFDWTPYLSEGFDVAPQFLLMNVVVAAGYLIPWFILGFYLIRSREVAA